MLLWLLYPSSIFTQFYISGEIAPSVMVKQSNFDIIDLPYRLVSSEISYGLGDIELKSTFALEQRIESGEFEGDLRELYAIWYPGFGEVKFGKQIHAWGAVDGNNPTDNINPYDYYFMFLPGTEQKLGVLSASANIYFDNWQAELILIPYHTANRIPYDEPDFPIIPIPEPNEEFIDDIENELEYGFRIKTMIGENDVSVSYFNGHDRSLTTSGIKTVGWEMYTPTFGFRNTTMYGADMVGFIGDLTYRIESAYFKTKNNDWLLKSDASYVQSVLQLEYTGIFDIQFSGQYIYSDVLTFSGYGLQWNGPAPPTTVENDESSFQPGMGTPFAFFTDQGLLGGAKATLWDNTLELVGNVFYDIDGKGKIVGINAEYSPVENWVVLLGASIFIGDDNKPDDPFTRLEDFSHFRMGLKYSF